MKHNIIKWWTF